MVLLELSLYGHPEAGNRWESTMTDSAGRAGFQPAPQWKSIFKEPKSGAALGVYVDGFEMAAPGDRTADLWAELDKWIEFGKPAAVWGSEPVRHLGCHNTVEQKRTNDGEVLTTISSSMRSYCEDVVRRFEERIGNKVESSLTPWLNSGAESRYKKEMEECGQFGEIAASPLMAGLYGARATRPDRIIPTLRLAR